MVGVVREGWPGGGGVRTFRINRLTSEIIGLEFRQICMDFRAPEKYIKIWNAGEVRVSVCVCVCVCLCTQVCVCVCVCVCVYCVCV